MGECKLCGQPCAAWQVYCGAACSAGWEMGQRPATPPEPAAPAPEPDEAERVAREWATSVGYEPEHETEQDRAGIASLATLLRSYGSDRERAAEARGRDAGLSEAARECEATMPSLTGVGGIGPEGHSSQTFQEPNYVSAACARRIRALRGPR